jgi:RNA recognition motif-containing protein
VVEFEDMEDGRNAVAELDGIEFGSKTLRLVVLTSRQGGMGKSKDLNSNILTVTWPAPSDIAFASYSSMDEARSKRAQLENKIFNGRKVKTNIAKKPATLPEIHWNPAAISISGLKPGTPLALIEEFCGTTSIRIPARNMRSYDLNDAIPSLRSLVVKAHPENHQSLTYEPNLIPNEHGAVSVKIHFPTWDHAKVVRDFLDQKPLPLCPQMRFFAFLLDPLHYTTHVPYPQYKAQEKLFQSLIPDKNDRSATTHLRILANQPNKGARIELSGSDKKTIGKLKVRIEQLTAGEKLPQWDRVFYGPEGERFLEKVYGESRAYIRVDKRQSTLKVFGEPAAVEQAKTMVREEVDRLASRQFEVHLKRASIRYFMDGARGLEVLKQEVGEGNVMLNVSSVPCKIVIQGGEAARHCLRKLIDESLSDAIRSQHQLKDGETCPVCYDVIDQSYRLDCGHAYCHGCLNHFLLSASDTKQFPLSCMGDEGMCGIPIPIPVIQRFLLPSQVKHLLEVSFLHYLDRHPGKFRYCATPGCPEIYSLESGSRDGIFRCRSCFVSVCVPCEEDHDGFSCEEWRRHQDLETQERLLEGWAEGSKDVKKCPKCKILIEKNGGCNHMTCPKCDAHICWRCMGVFTPATIYGHMERVHGGMLDGDEPDDILI